MSGLTIVVGNKAYSSWSLRGWLMVAATGERFEEIVIPLDRPETGGPSGRIRRPAACRRSNSTG